jgi:uncharacterized protein YecE (DUF72 family)
MRLLTGTSGFSYKQWCGTFYPEKLPAEQMLQHYAARLRTVEINNTFYRMPKPDQLEAWAKQTPESFSFVLKAPRMITHTKRLAKCESDVSRLCDVSSTLGVRRGPLLFQLPPFLKKSVERLSGFLTLLRQQGPSVQAAIEFRHESWFDDEIYGLLKDAGVALCLADSETISTPIVATAGFGYIRLRRQDYDETALRAWADKLKELNLASCHVFFKHEDDGAGPQLAAKMVQLVEG